jgi:hypothetical protein
VLFQNSRRPLLVGLAVLIVVVAFLACASRSGDESGAVRALPCDVERVLETHCGGCHGREPRFGAPMPVVNYDDLAAPSPRDPSRTVAAQVQKRIHDDARPMPPPPNPRLSASDRAILDTWIDGGAQAASSACQAPSATDGAAAPAAAPLSCVPDRRLTPPAPYAVARDVDDAYVCFGVDVTETAKRHITAIAPRIANEAVVHHMVLFQADEPFSSTPAPCGFFGSASWRMVAVWAPGGVPFELPAQAGVPLEGTTHYIVQLHYNNLRRLEGQTDASGFELCTTPNLRAYDADVMAFGAVGFEVPARSTTDLTCDFTVPPLFGEGRHIVATMPHMHVLGARIGSTLLPGGDAAAGVPLGGRDPWNFESQYWDRVEATVRPGDVVRARCAWRNPGDSVVSFGEATHDEMCFTFAFYYPRIQAPRWSWAAPSALATCAPTAP